MSTEVITVGVDGSEPSNTAFRFAIEEAHRRQATIRAVTIWEASSLYTAGGVADLVDWRYQDYSESAQALQNDAIDSVLATIPADQHPVIDRRVIQGEPGYALVETARDTALLIVGTEHKGLLKRIAQGSISSYCTRYSQIPVVIVPFVRKSNAS